MDKRKIREGVKKIISLYPNALGEELKRWEDNHKGEKIAIPVEDIQWGAAERITKKLWNYLHSQGVVIRLDNGSDLTGCCIARLESLIEELI